MLDSDTTTNKTFSSNDEKLEAFKRDIIHDADVVSDQRDKANEDMRFINVSGGMWEGFLEDQFSDRTKLEFDIISNYVNRFVGQWNQNRLGVQYKSDDSNTSDEDAELLNGIYRADFLQFSGKMSVDNAVDEQATCGYGCFKLATKFVDDEDPENDDQRIEWRPIYNAYNTIIWDKAAKRIDKKDARHCTELIMFTRDSFKAAYPEADAVSAYTPRSRSFQNYEMSDQELIYVAKRYQIVRKKVTVYVYNNLIDDKIEVYSEEDHKLIADELKSNKFKSFVRKRKVIRQYVETTVFSGDEILENTRRIVGKWIPIVPIYGYHAFVDGVEWYRGLVRKLMDAARLYNMQVSQLAENSASSGQEVPIFDPEQMQGGVSDAWADRNTKPYLLARALRDNDGNIIQHGPLGYLKAPQLDGNTQSLLQIVPAFVQDATGGAPQDTLDPDASGKAINALQKREDLNTQTLNDNIANAIQRSGEIYASMAEEVYSSRRTMKIVGIDGTESEKILMKTVLDEKTGKLVHANDLTGKKFRVYPDVGPQYDTLKEQTVEDLKGMLEVLRDQPGGQQYTDAIIATILENIDGVGLGPIKDIVRKNMIAQGLIPPETDEEKQQLAAAQEAANQPDPNQQLIEAAALQAEGEARERESKVADNIASANLKTAKAEQTLAEIEIDLAGAENDRIKTLQEVREQQFKNLSSTALQ